MPNLNPFTAWRAFLSLSNASPQKALGVAFLVALVCSIIVSVTAISLKPQREANRIGESLSSLAAMVENLDINTPQKRFVERETGAYVEREVRSLSYLDPNKDTAGLFQIEDVLTVYEVRVKGRVELLILPIRGAGYKSMMKGYLALRDDFKTIAALTFYEQDETPGMGAEIMNTQWQDQWVHKQTRDDTGRIRIEVIKGRSRSPYAVNGISGATRTGWGVTNLMHFWLGPDGYGPYIERLELEATR